VDNGSSHGGAGLRAILHRLFEHMRAEQHRGSCRPERAGRLDPQGSGGYPGDSAGGPDGGYAGGFGARAGSFSPRNAGTGAGAGARAGAGAGAGAGTKSGRTMESTVTEVCPPSVARPIVQVGPKVVFAEEDLI
jgi:hypothetical protein